jgi:peptidoglycan/xylan/chitin deacetylase (PgdA/CDA1 family)
MRIRKVLLFILAVSAIVGYSLYSKTTVKSPEKEIKEQDIKPNSRPVNRFANITKENSTDNIPVLMYHDVIQEDDTSDGNKMPIKVFEEQMQYLKENGYTTITNEEFIQAYNQKIFLPQKSVLITFDDGFKSIKTLIEPILKKYDFRATSFIIGSFITREQWHLTKSEISQISSRSIINFESHTYNLHEYKDKRGMIETTSAAGFIQDNKLEEDILGHKVNILCYPFGNSNGNAIQNLVDGDIEFGFAIIAGASTKVMLNESHSNEIDGVQDKRNLPRVRVNANTQLNTFKELIK